MISLNGANTEVNASFTHTSIGPEVLLGLPGGRGDLRIVGHVRGDDQRLAARLRHIGGRPLQARLAPGDQHHPRAPLAEQPGGSPPDPPARPGDHHGLLPHLRPPLC